MILYFQFSPINNNKKTEETSGVETKLKPLTQQIWNYRR